MTFLRNAWYAAGWAEELTDRPLARTFLGEPVAMYRKSDGTPAAIGDRCPHRFAPLHLGKRKGDALECPYHGLQFDGTGACVRNPHGDGKIPAAARVPAYPLVEKYGALWIWMGEPAKADPAGIVDIMDMTYRLPAVRTVRGALHVKGNYQLVADNLLDLSHVQYLHPMLGAAVDFEGEYPDQRYEMKHDGNTVWMYAYIDNFPVTPFYKLQWGEANAPKRGDMRAHMRWDAPGVLQLDTGMTVKGGTPDQGPSAPSVHLLTPESETSTHYFWCVSHDRQIDNAQVTAMVKTSIADAFENEDEPMVAAVQQMMGTSDLMSLKPVLLSGDSAALRARRVLNDLIRGETPPPARAKAS